MRVDPIELEETLAARGVRPGLDISLDATVTPVTLGVTAPTGAGPTTLPALDVTLPAGSAPAAGVESPSEAPPVKGDLEILALLGEGGMGRVYLARDPALGREVAVKTPREASAGAASAALCEEAMVTGALEHPAIVPVHQLARARDGRPLLVMKRVEGISWRDLLADADHRMWAALAVPAADRLVFHLEVLRRVCEALAFAHSRRIVHRDVKPENVMVGEFGEVYLVDWGLAVRADQARAGEPMVGTPRYMAPEMILGGPVSPQTDVYLLGATLHEVLTGEPPHRGHTLLEVLHAALEAAPYDYGDEAPADLAELCRRAMASDPEARPVDAGAFRAVLSAHARHRASLALSSRADERLAQLRARVSEPLAEAELPALYRLVAECRFAFAEAEREWPNNPAVAPGTQGCLEAAVAIELWRRDPGAARALITELPQPAPALEARLRALEAELAAEQAAAERLRRLAERADAGADPRARLAAGLFGGIGATALSGYALYLDLARRLSGADLVLFALGAVAVAAVAVALLGRSLLGHAFNRRLVLWMFGILGGLLVSRIAGMIGGTPPHLVLAHDLAVMAACFGVGAMWLFPLLAAGAVPLAAGAFAAARLPGHGALVFGVATALALAVALFAAHRARGSAPGGPPP